jgi:hypothetical protein
MTRNILRMSSLLAWTAFFSFFPSTGQSADTEYSTSYLASSEERTSSKNKKILVDGIELVEGDLVVKRGIKETDNSKGMETNTVFHFHVVGGNKPSLLAKALNSVDNFTTQTLMSQGIHRQQEDLG